MKSKKVERVRFAVIGGSGLYKIPSIRDLKEIQVKTPFGPPSAPIALGTIGGVRCAFLPRHGRGHRFLPTELPSKANIYALKSLGVERILSMGAVGSLKEELPPRHFVFPDQLVDETRHRNSTFFGEGLVAHIAFAHPFCDNLSDALFAAAKKIGIKATRGGTYCCMEGPQFSTRAESEMHRRQGYSIIGMTAAGVGKLAREAAICDSPVAMVTDYDCWKEEDEVSTKKVIEHLMANVGNAQKLIEASLPILAGGPTSCACNDGLKGAVFTQPDAINKKTVKRLELLIRKYVKD
ncbi:MAG: S-methyl-5'-thioadenosine phosphorylase, partial [Elusimicrobiota bacterium]